MKSEKKGGGQPRSSFSGRLGYVLAVAGSAVGLGNIWRFPYLAAKYGGGIFLLVYLILMFTFGYALIVSETALANDQTQPGGSFSGVWPQLDFPLWRLDERHHSDGDCFLLLRDWRLGN